MTQFEVRLNGTDNLKGKRTICTVINNLKTGEAFTADLVAIFQSLTVKCL